MDLYELYSNMVSINCSQNFLIFIFIFVRPIRFYIRLVATYARSLHTCIYKAIDIFFASLYPWSLPKQK